MARTRTTRERLRRHAAALIAGMVVLGIGAGNVSAAQASAVSDTVILHNGTGCNLLRVAYWLDGGVTTISPNASIPAGTSDYWKTESNGAATGTEGHARYITMNCSRSWLNSSFVQVHWDNPFVGANSYDYDGTTFPFVVPHSGGGGYHAVVDFYAQSAF